MTKVKSELGEVKSELSFSAVTVYQVKSSHGCMCLGPFMKDFQGRRQGGLRGLQPPTPQEKREGKKEKADKKRRDGEQRMNQSFQGYVVIKIMLVTTPEPHI